jgi:nucleoside-diphosphate-sugar epimerase
MNILAIGGTGNVGSRVIEELLRRGATVRALVRNKEAEGKLRKGVEPAIGDAVQAEVYSPRDAAGPVPVLLGSGTTATQMRIVLPRMLRWLSFSLAKVLALHKIQP